VKESRRVAENTVWELLQEVTDPEIPVISMVEMGMIHKVHVADESVTVEVLPTFVGCPALEIMKKNIADKLATAAGVQNVQVNFLYEPAWSSNRISDEGREKLRSFGIAPPPKDFQAGDEWEVHCPYCHSPYTKMENLFGPAACRSILYCKQCKNPFEALKPM